jgi:hypothetical protein
MPVQHTVFGRPIRLHMPPRRFQVLFALAALIFTTLFLFGPPTSADLPTYEQVNPFGPAAHKPPVQPNSNSSSPYGVVQWFSNHKWRNPFSSDVTLDENTAVLPPLKQRPTIYSFYEAREKQSKEVSEAENRLVLAWRRAWWAQGFRPQVLSRGDSMKHPQYQLVQRLKLEKVDPAVEAEIMRWLAWAQMGGGILASWHALPMAEYDNPILSFLRKEQYPDLSRIETLQDGLFFGEVGAINSAIKKAIESPLFKNMTLNHDKIVDLKKDAGAMVNLLQKKDVKPENQVIKVEKMSHGIAYYSPSTINNLYKSPIVDKLTNATDVKGLDLLADLINSHLHLTFQNIFSEGIAVVKPLPEHTTALMYESIDIARNLTQCPSSPLPGSCPPNRSKCKPCNPKKPIKLRLLPSMQNSSNLYSIGTVPHPYTLSLLHFMRDSVDANFLRANARRDQWLSVLTQDMLGNQRSSSDRVVLFKETVASPQSASNSVWLTAERVSQADLEWIFGFKLPQIASPNNAPSEESELTIFPRPGEPEPIEGVEVQEEKWIRNEEARLKKAREAIKSTDKHWKEVVNMVEQWNPADTEAWRFARAFSARRRQERKKWEEEEKKFGGSEHKAGVGGGDGSRWIDKLV